jgi:uncharacterized protein DUF6588
MLHSRGWMAFALVALVLPAPVLGSTLEDNLSAFPDETAEGYLKPLQTSFGQGLNSNLFTTASLPLVGFHARLEIKAMSMFFSDGDKTFSAKTGGDFTPQQTVQASTAVGPGQAVTVTGDGGTQFVFPGGFDMTSLTIGVPQITVSGLATEAMIRWVGFDSNDQDIGTVSLLGLGLRHSISKYLKDVPLDLAAGIYYHKFNVESDLVHVETWSFGAQGSKSFGLITPYGGLSYDTVQMTSKYTAKNGAEEETVHLDMGTEKTFHLSAGGDLTLGFFHANIGLDWAKHFGVNSGVSFGF